MWKLGNKPHFVPGDRLWIFTITQVIEKKTAYNQELPLFYIDLKKAYDSIPHIKLWEALQTTNISTELIKIVKKLYQQSQTKYSAWFYDNKRVNTRLLSLSNTVQNLPRTLIRRMEEEMQKYGLTIKRQRLMLRGF